MHWQLDHKGLKTDENLLNKDYHSIILFWIETDGCNQRPALLIKETYYGQKLS